MYRLQFTDTSKNELADLKKDNSRNAIYKAVIKSLKFLENDPKHPSLNSKPFKTLSGPSGEKLWESYAQQNTPGAYRIFWYYGPERKQITITSIISHP